MSRAPRLCIATQQFDALPQSDRLLCETLHAEAAVWSDPSLDWSRFDAVIVRSCWDYHLRCDEFLQWAGRVPVRLINSLDLIRWNADKRYLRTLQGIEIPETVWLDSASDHCDIEVLCHERGWPAAVVKPFISASAHRTEKRRDGLAHGPAMVQRFLPEISSLGEWSLLYFGGVYSHAVLKSPAQGDFRVQKEFGGTLAPAHPSRELRDFAEKALKAMPYRPTIARVDVLETQVLMELEAIEPEIFLDSSDQANRAAAAILASLE